MIHTVVRDTKYGFVLNKQGCNFKRKYTSDDLCLRTVNDSSCLPVLGGDFSLGGGEGLFLLLEVLVGLFQLVLVDGEVLLHLGELLLEIADFLVDLGEKTDLVLGHQYIIEPFVLLSLSLTKNYSYYNVAKCLENQKDCISVQPTIKYTVRNVDYVLYLVL